jgi:hypothetical protein
MLAAHGRTPVRLAVLFLVAMSCLLAFSQTPNAGRAHAGVTIRVEPLRHIREDVDLWPHIAQPKGDAELRVNARLTRLNQAFVKDLRDCDAGIIEFEKGECDSQASTKDDWSRGIKITMRGPRFLSMIARMVSSAEGAIRTTI